MEANHANFRWSPKTNLPPTAGWALTASILLLLACSLPACASEEKSEAKQKTEVTQTYALIASAVYDDCLAGAEKLQARVSEFLAKPSEATLTAARVAWIAARKPYLQSEVFRFCEGPVEQVEGRINSWPIDENYIDYVEGSTGGIINNSTQFPTLSRELLESLNEREGEKNICMGFHAIEFLLWGQDHNPEGPGDRAYRDFVVGSLACSPNSERRREYLQLVTWVLVDDLRTLAKAWAAGDATNYRAWFLASAPHQALGKMLHGMGTLGGVELAGERLTVPYETKEQEDEHSCFSDTTSLDVLNNALGIQNIYLGRYACSDGTRIKGPSLHELLTEIDPNLAKELAMRIDAGVEAARLIPDPFDRAILGKDTASGRQAIHRAIQALQAQSDPIARARSLVGTRKGEP
jgi:putative iron-regulated protein